MPCLEKLSLNGTAIKVLPSSIENISGLKVLTLAFCRNLADLPNSIYKLRHLERLLLEGCSKLDKFPVNGDNEVPTILPASSGSDFLPAQANSLEVSSFLTFPWLRWLDLQNCCLGNVNFLKMHNCFPMLKELDLSGNIFAIIPETLLLFTHLKSLRLNKCKKLQEIPALPRNIKRLEARDCELLERYSPLDKEGKWPARLRVVDFSNCHKLAKNEGKNVEDAFFSKALHQKFQVEMFLPGSKIPEWFTSTSEQGSLTYHLPSFVLEKIQGLVICSILCLEDGTTATISCEMFVDGKSMILCSRDFFPLETDHMWLHYQPYCYTRALGSARNDSVRFDISFEVLGAPGGSALKMCGIYFVCKRDKTMIGPSSTQSTSYHTDQSVSFDLMTSCYKVDPEFKMRPNMNRKRPETLDSSGIFNNDLLELGLNSRVNRRKTANDQFWEQFSFSLQPMDQKPGNPLIASKSGEHQLEHWLSLSLQPMDRKQNVQFPMCRNFFNELCRALIGEHADVEYETEKDERLERYKQIPS
ncbi:REPEAT-CONTAINING PROTEIN putative-RELATED [Salix purpurea]|uniref:REPEAT-CONTAINING PROTEIN putative-RELATED n=1 Tax=Salix purpurea TaxID=77065 RepID=A0A9Q0V954_SALPP|nr:REPEAT-CONTAINING PROTEIN putative-RELATED [Salix purpurea]